MNALDTLIELSGQMELEHAEENRAERSATQSKREPAKPACFTPKARPEFTEREKSQITEDAPLIRL
jgi:hypothetical protein